MLNKYTSFIIVATVLALAISVLLTVGYLFFIDKRKTNETKKALETAKENIVSKLKLILPTNEVDSAIFIVTEEIEKIFNGEKQNEQ